MDCPWLTHITLHTSHLHTSHDTAHSSRQKYDTSGRTAVLVYEREHNHSQQEWKTLGSNELPNIAPVIESKIKVYTCMDNERIHGWEPLFKPTPINSPGWLRSLPSGLGSLNLSRRSVILRLLLMARYISNQMKLIKRKLANCLNWCDIVWKYVTQQKTAFKHHFFLNVRLNTKTGVKCQLSFKRVFQ